MKNFFLILIPITLLGFGVVGLGQMVAFKPWTKPGQEEEFKEFKRIIALPMVEDAAAKRPKVDCQTTEYNFGLLPPFTHQNYEFVIANNGDHELVLKKGGESCTCLEADLSAALVAPGEKKTIPVSWNTDKQGKFAQFVKVVTNSPETPEVELWVTGMVATILESSVGSFGYEAMLADEVRTQDFYLYSGVWDKVEIDRIECSSETVQCERIEQPKVVEDPLKVIRKPVIGPEYKSRADFRMTVKAQNNSEIRTETVKIYVRPSQSTTSAETSGEESPESMVAAITKQKLQPDGTMLVELPVTTKTARRLSLYGPAIADGKTKLIDLGKLRTTSPAQEWTIIAKIRGDKYPTDFKVALTGIEGVSVSVEQVENKPGIPYRIKIYAEEKLRLGLHNGAQAGKLIIDAPGLPGEEHLEFTVDLDVLEET